MSDISRSSYVFALGIGLLIAVPVAPALGATIVDELEVTVQRRVENLSEVPISVTVFQNQAIERANMRGSRDFVLRTPNVTFAENDAQGSKNGDIAIRGISDLTAGGNERIIQTRPAIGFNVDEFSVTSIASGSANPPLNDVERIEILRGPQGTYFGRNATGGAINIVTRKPDENPYAKLHFGVGSFDTYTIGAIGNVPLTDELFVRGSAVWEESDGVVDNLYPGGNGADYRDVSARGAVRWQPGDWTIDLSAQITQETQGNQGKIPTGIDSAGFLDAGPGAAGPTDPVSTCGKGASLFFQNGNNEDNCENAPTFTDIDNTLLIGRVEYAGQRFTFTSITGLLDSKFDQLEDLDNSGWDIFNRRNDYSGESISQEFRFSSADDWSLGNIGWTWTVGVYAYDDEFQTNNTIITGTDSVPGFTGFLSVPGDHPNENSQNVERDGWAIFFDTSFDFTERLTLLIGGRYSEDNDKQFWRNTYASFDCGTRTLVGGVEGALAPACELRPDQTAPLPAYRDGAGDTYVTGGRFQQALFTDGENDGDDFSGRIGLSFQATDEHNIYLTLSQGYRAAGVRNSPDSSLLGPQVQLGNEPAADTRSFFDKEKLNSLEAGWKGVLFDGQTFAQFSVFFMQWEDMQVRLDRFICPLADGSFVPFNSPAAVNCVSGPQPDSRVFNANEAESKGAEFTIQSLIGEQFEVGGFLGYLNAEFTDFKDSPFGDISGKELPSSSEWTAGIDGKYDWQMAGGTGYVRVEALYRDTFRPQFAHMDQTEFPYVTDDFTVVNLQTGIEWDNQTVFLTVDNLFDEDYFLGNEDFTQTGINVQPHPTFVRLSWTMEFSGL